MIETEVAIWPAVRDVMAKTQLSQSYISQLIHAGRLNAYRTRLGWLVDPESIAQLEAERAARKERRKR